ncbi:hypothetical protein CNR22_03275 [Sphingobacteriaceae bacterium]|nr:hypothetical protein CNR22_03275 [Sphingobacteriaceae bacterium]
MASKNFNPKQMKKLLLFLAFGTYLKCESQITASSTLVCDGQSVTLVAPPTRLNTTLAGGNNHRGNMFNLVAINTLTITSFDAHPQGNTTIEIYYKAGTYSGFENASTSWTLVGSAAVTAQPFGNLTPVPVAINVVIPAGQTYAFYVTSNNTAVALNYSNGTTAGSVYSSDANLQFIEGIGLEYPFTGSPFSPRVWNGRINYNASSTTYTWSNGASTYSTSVSPSITTTYSVAVNSATNTSSISISVNPSPTVSINNGTICSGNSFSIIPSGADTYTIQGGNSNVSPLSNSTYTVKGTASNGCLSINTATLNLTVNTTPTVSVNDGTICSGNSFSIIPSGASTYTIEGGNTNVSPLVNSTFTVNGTASNGCVSANTATLNLTVNTTPTVSVNNGTICSGNSFSIIPSGANTYTIEGGNTNVSPLISSTYTVSGTAANGCVSANTATANLTVNTTPTVSVNSGTICSGNSFTILPSGASTYTIDGGSTTVSPLINSSFTVNGTASNGCVSANTATSNVTVNTTPTVSVTDGTICSGNSFSIVPSGADTYTIEGGSSTVSPVINSTYTVNGTATNGCLSANVATLSLTVNTTPTLTVNSGLICTGQSFTIIASGADTFTFSSGSNIVSPAVTSVFSVTGTSSLGCIAANTAISTVTVVTNPTITVNSGAICAGGVFVLIPGGASTYTFSSGSASVSPTSNTTYSVTGSVGPGCIGTNTAVATITVNPLPTLSASSTSSVICATESVIVTANGALTYTWNATTASSVITISPAVTTSYTLAATDANGCQNTLLFTQDVSECTGVTQQAKAPLTISIFPNPGNGIYSVNSETTLLVSVYDALGKMVLSEKLSEGKQQIDLSAFKNGFYILKAEAGNGSKTFKLIKE